MPAFAYRAVDTNGAKHRGVVEAPNAVGARRLLRERDLLPVSVEVSPGSGARRPVMALPRLTRGGKINARALSTLTRQVSTLVSSDINIEEALRLVANQTESAAAAAVLTEVRGRILDGRSFASALGDFPGAFPEYYRASVAAGEHSGRLADVLAHLADFVDGRQRNQQKIQLALLYPMLLACVSFGMMALLLVYVVPDIVKVFVSRGADLPFLTRALIAVSAGLQAYGVALLLFVLVTGFLVQRWLKVPANRLRFHRRLATTPPFMRFSRQHNAARFAGSLATLVQSAVPLVEALTSAAAVTPNRYVRERAMMVATRVREGASLQASIVEAAVFPSMLVAIVASGESSGKLGMALGRAAAELERELDALVATIVGLVEPAVLLMMGGLVLLMVLAILLPIINLNNLAGM